jgi:putative nucleotidyltransferase with HDIG domain
MLSIGRPSPMTSLKGGDADELPRSPDHVLLRRHDLVVLTRRGGQLLMHKIRFLLGGVLLGASATCFAVYNLPTGGPGSLESILLLSALALIAEYLAFALPRAARGSVAFIPYMAAVVVAPMWPTPLAIAAVRAIADLVSRRQAIKVTYNAAVYATSISVAILVYRGLGGTSLLAQSASSLYEATARSGFAAFSAISVALLTNNILVSTAIALTSSASLRRVLRDNVLGSLGLDIVASPLIFVFAWVYAQFGAIAAAAAWVPILGMRLVYKTNLELEQTNEELLQLMVKSIEARDPYTSGHSRRVQTFATQIARALRLPDKDVRRINRAALLHDVGKIYDKYHPILTKPDRLTAAEWATMKEHPVDGAGLVATMTRLQDLVPAIRHHHEHWDGTGYPDGIAGEQIPVDARVITLADTIDAMLSDRPYRKGLTPEQVRTEIIRCRGRQYDPEMVDRLLASPMWSSLFSSPSSVSVTSSSNSVSERRIA